MNKFIKHLLYLGFLGLSGSAYAQAPHVCGAGPGPNEVMAGMHSGGHGVAPTPLCYWKSESPQGADPSPVRWADRWGAIAQADNDVAGIVSGKENKTSATREAIAECKMRGGQNCKISLTYYNQCAVVIAGTTGSNISHAAYSEEATTLAMKGCEKRDGIGNCRVYYSGCSLPVRLN